MATVTPAQATHTGTTLFGTAPTASTGDQISNPRGRTALFVTNASGSSINVTISAAPGAVRPADGSYPSQSLPDIVVAVAAGAAKMIGPVPVGYNDAAGTFKALCSSVGSVTISAVEIV